MAVEFRLAVENRIDVKSLLRESNVSKALRIKKIVNEMKKIVDASLYSNI